MMVITTPSGQIGRQLVEDLVDRSAAVRVVVRDPASLPPHIRERVEVVPGSHGDPEVAAAAFAGAASVFLVVPPEPRTTDVDAHYLRFARVACDAVREHGVERIVAVSSLGRGVAKDAGHISAALAMDELFDAAGAHFRVLRLPFFMENLLTQAAGIRDRGEFWLANAADRPLRAVATRDIAAAAAGLLLDDAWTGHGDVPVVSPDDLSPDGMAAVMSEVLGRPIEFRRAALEDYRATMLGHGMSEAWAQGLADMAAVQNERDVYDLAPETRRAPTGFRRWCAEVLRPALRA
ncbi:NAD(P)H-binding protein [Dactylosporangium sp. NPDC048998]|uniref:NAD(P)H-binding protein n=1 Tax=Dactylosporangium sp. NPDC048998 TaxID=3363976 RepID=UPI003712BB68